MQHPKVIGWHIALVELYDRFVLWKKSIFGGSLVEGQF
jgi:hypothetical protein